MIRPLRQRLASGELTIGSWLSFGHTPITEIMARAGFDWLVIDMEHKPIDVWEAFQMIQIIDLAGCVPLVRVGANDELLIKRVLDAGAHGVIVPMVNTSDEAARAVAAARYAPQGRRGTGLGRAHAYGTGFQRYWDWAQENVVVIVQIEHVDGVRNLEEILATEGVDGYIIGPYDLSCSLGCPGDFEAPEFVEAMEEVGSYTRSASKPAGFHIVHSGVDRLRKRVAEGYRFIAYGDDMIFLAEKARDAGRERETVLGASRPPGRLAWEKA
jgi:2-keto-3-deoxy-L-rhamnonate aldolase RhmA